MMCNHFETFNCKNEVAPLQEEITTLLEQMLNNNIDTYYENIDTTLCNALLVCVSRKM